MAKKEISWILRARDTVSTVLNRLSRRFSSFASGGIKFAKLLFSAFALIGGAAVAMGGKFIAAYHKQAQAEAKLKAVLKATGYAAGFTTEQLKAQASELQKQTGIGDELILSMQGILASFRNISGDNFQEATKAILDMSTVMTKAGNDTDQIEASVIQVGKALNDPIKGISALSRVGVTFTEQQKEQIAAMQQAGDLAGAQKIILEELKNEFDGAAEGVDANVKSYRLFTDALGDAQEEAGRAITENLALSSVFDKFTKILNELVDSGVIELWAERLASAANEAMKYISPVIEGMGKIYHFIQKVGATAGGMMEGMSFEDAYKMSDEVIEDMKKEKEAKLETIRFERAERKKTAEEAEQQEMKVAKAKREVRDKVDAKAKAEGEISAITKDLEYRTKLQQLLNKGKEEEAKLLEIQKKLGRELTEDEKSRIGEKLQALKKAEDEGKAPEIKTVEPEKTALERIGAIYGTQPSSKDQTKKLESIVTHTKKTNQILEDMKNNAKEASLGAV